MDVMKKYIIILLSAVLALSGCRKEPQKKALDISGDWALVGLETKSANVGDVVVEVYLSFNDGRFVLYQKVGEGRFRAYDGTYTLTSDLLEGAYSDGKPWGTSYKVSLEDGLMILSSLGEQSTYRKSEIPSEALEAIR